MQFAELREKLEPGFWPTKFIAARNSTENLRQASGVASNACCARRDSRKHTACRDCAQDGLSRPQKLPTNYGAITITRALRRRCSPTAPHPWLSSRGRTRACSSGREESCARIIPRSATGLQNTARFFRMSRRAPEPLPGLAFAKNGTPPKSRKNCAPRKECCSFPASSSACPDTCASASARIRKSCAKPSRASTNGSRRRSGISKFWLQVYRDVAKPRSHRCNIRAARKIEHACAERNSLQAQP